MMGTVMEIPYPIFTVLEDHFGREGATKVASGLQQVLTNHETRMIEQVKHAKLEVKDEVKRELVAELATKEDIARLEGVTKEDIARLEGVTKEDIATLRGEVKEEIAKLDGKIDTLRSDMKLYFAMVMAVVVIVNKDAFTLLGQIIGLVK